VRVQVVRVDLTRRQVELGIEAVLAAVRADERARGPRRSRATPKPPPARRSGRAKTRPGRRERAARGGARKKGR
jgi:hypothetical protein